MRLHAVRLCNFRQHADTRIEFKSGLTGIIGANGSGKTTILEAIAWAIYGNPAARGTRDSIRFNRAGARASVSVELDFELGGHRYRVNRGLTSATLYLDGASSPIANSISGVTELLQRRIGMSRDEFFNTYFTGQKELSVMAAMGPAERAQFLSHVLGYERLRDAQKLLREKRSALVAQIAGLRQGMADPDVVHRQLQEAELRVGESEQRAAEVERRLASSQAEFAAISPRFAEAQAERERLRQVRAEATVASAEVTSRTRDVERLGRELAELVALQVEHEQLSETLETLPALSSEFQRLEVLAREEGRRRTLADALRSATEELDRLRERRDRIQTAPKLEEEVAEQLTARRDELESMDGQLEARRTEWVRDRQDAETKRQSLRDQFGELRVQRDRLASTGEEGNCPTCLRPLGESLASVLEMLDAQMETVRVDGNFYKARYEQLLEMPEDLRTLDERRRALTHDVTALERKLTKVQLAVGELSQVSADLAAKEARTSQLAAELDAIPATYDAERHEVLRGEMERLRGLEARRQAIAQRIEREPTLGADLAEARTALATASARVAEARAGEMALAEAESRYDSLRVEHDRASEEVRTAQLGAVSAQGDVSMARSRLQSAEQAARDLAERQRALGELNAQKRLHDELDRAYTDLRTDLNYRLRPELSELASRFLSELTDGRYGEVELDDQYNIIVLEDAVPKPVISGGEEDLANLVLRLAISQMIAERAGQPFSILILDEIFGSLDELRRANVVDLLRHLQDRFEQVILITHIESVREGLDHVVTVRYDEETGCSTVEQLDEEKSEEQDQLPLSAQAGAAD